MNFKKLCSEQIYCYHCNVLFKSPFRFQLTAVFLFTLYFLNACRTGRPVLQQVSEKQVPITSEIGIDSSIMREILPYKSALDKEMNSVLIFSDSVAIKDEPEGSLGNLVADLLLEKARALAMSKNLSADVCLLNKGGLRAPLPKGEITLGKVYELMPFENELVLVTLSPDKFKGMLNYIARSAGQPMAGMRMQINDSTFTEVTLDGRPLEDNRNYSVLTSDYLAFGGDKMRFFKDPVSVVFLNKKIRDVLVEAMIEKNSKGMILKPRKDGRITQQK
jgi:2',3'-cyclic-nucleotide 2'-phosphodiesterase (5'-nucleotidase family)